MSFFDARIRVGQVTVAPVQEREDGPIYEAEIMYGLLSTVPVGPGQHLPIPIGGLRAPFDKESIGAIIKELQDVHERMSTRPNIEVANSLEGVERATQIQDRLR